MTHEQPAGFAAANETVIAVVPNITLMKGFLGQTTGKKYKGQLGSGAKQAREALIEAEMI